MHLVEDGVVDIWNRTDDRALINLVPHVVQTRLLEASQKRPKLFGLDERSLFKTLRSEKKSPTPTDNRLRLAFWNEYDRAQALNKPRMEIIPIISGICIQPYFYNEYLFTPEKVAWLVCRPTSYEVMMEEALAFGIEQLRDILEIPHSETDAESGKSKLNTKLMELKAKIIQMLDIRVKGAPVQRIENKNLNISATEKQVQNLAQCNSLEEIERRLAELRKRDRLNPPPETIEVKPEVPSDSNS